VFGFRKEVSLIFRRYSRIVSSTQTTNVVRHGNRLLRFKLMTPAQSAHSLLRVVEGIPANQLDFKPRPMLFTARETVVQRIPSSGIRPRAVDWDSAFRTEEAC